MAKIKIDATLNSLVEYVNKMTYERLTPSAIHHTKKLLIDSLGCAIGGYSGEPCIIARNLATSSTGNPPARIIGSGIATTIEMATFSNSVMLRYLDFNDTYTSIGEGHPSDAIPAVLASAEAFHASGKTIIAALAATYEVYMALADTVGLAERGWDHGFFVVLASVAGTGKILNLNSEQMAHAFSIAGSANIPTRQTRRGELSMWKGCATALSAREGVFATLLAKEGITGPPEAFEGKHGIWDQITGKFALPILENKQNYFAVERSGIKFFPTEYHSHVPLLLLQQLGKDLVLENIKSIHIEANQRGYSETGNEPQRWDPRTRETADHSLPYMLSIILTDGHLTIDSFQDQRILDPALRPIMKKISVSENIEFTRNFPKLLQARVSVTTNDGKVHVAEGNYPKGHEYDPMTDEEVELKFRELCLREMSDENTESLLDTLWHLEDAPNLNQIMNLMCFDPPKLTAVHSLIRD